MELTIAQIIEGNKLISKSIFAEKDIIDWVEDIKNPSDKFCLNVLKYHSSFDWLMPVIEKFESIGGFVRIEKTEIIVHHSGIKDINLCCVSYMINNGKVLTSQEKLEGVWLGIVNFLKEYNQKLNISL